MALPHILQKNPKANCHCRFGRFAGILDESSESHKDERFREVQVEFIPEEERILHYAACDVAVFPSFYEPFGIVVLEAMAMERPVVVGAAGISGNARDRHLLWRRAMWLPH